MGLNTDNRTYAQTASIIGGIASDSLENVYVISNAAIGRYMLNNKKTDGVNFDTPLKESFERCLYIKSKIRLALDPLHRK